MPPVDPIKGLRRDDRRPPTSPVEVASGASVGRTTTGGIPPVEPTAKVDGWTMTSGMPPVEPGVCSMPGGLELCTVDVGCTTTSGMPPVEVGVLSTTEDEGCTMI
jgi:hypothetical protein